MSDRLNELKRELAALDAELEAATARLKERQRRVDLMKKLMKKAKRFNILMRDVRQYCNSVAGLAIDSRGLSTSSILRHRAYAAWFARMMLLCSRALKNNINRVLNPDLQQQLQPLLPASTAPDVGNNERGVSPGTSNPGGEDQPENC